MPNFKIGLDEISSGVIMNDSVAEAMRSLSDDPVDAIAASLGVDVEALTRIAMGRSAMVLEGADYRQSDLNNLPVEILIISLISSAWLDGFFAALHIVEQQNLTKTP